MQETEILARSCSFLNSGQFSRNFTNNSALCECVLTSLLVLASHSIDNTSEKQNIVVFREVASVLQILPGV